MVGGNILLNGLDRCPACTHALLVYRPERPIFIGVGGRTHADVFTGGVNTYMWGVWGVGSRKIYVYGEGVGKQSKRGG